MTKDRLRSDDELTGVTPDVTLLRQRIREQHDLLKCTLPYLTAYLDICMVDDSGENDVATFEACLDELAALREELLELTKT